MSLQIADRKKIFLLSLLLFAGTFLLFSPAINYDFIHYDDGGYVKENVHIAEGLNLKTVKWAFTDSYAANWHPLTWLSHAADVSLFGLSPGGHHAVSILIHCLNAVLAFLFFYLLLGRVGPAFWISFIFAIHPLRVESVVWISERKDVLSLFWGLAAMISYVCYTRSQKSGQYLLTLILFAFSLMAKQTLVILPFLLLLIDAWPLDRVKEKGIYRLILEKIPFLSLGVIVGLLTLWAQQDAIAPALRYPFLLRMLDLPVKYASYLSKSLLPLGLSIFYPFAIFDYLPKLTPVFTSLGLTIVTLGSLVARKKHPYLWVGWFWFLIAFLPVIGIINVGSHAIADRYTYIPHLGLCFALVLWVEDFVSRYPVFRLATYLCVVVYTGWLLMLTARYIPKWQSTEKLFEHMLYTVPEHPMAHQNFGMSLIERKEYDRALPHLKRALELREKFPETRSKSGMELAAANYNLAELYALRGENEVALDYYHEALKLDAEFAKAYKGRADIYQKQKRYDLALKDNEKLISFTHDDPVAHNNLGNLYAIFGNYEKAAAHYKTAIALKPDYQKAKDNYQIFLAELEKVSKTD